MRSPESLVDRKAAIRVEPESGTLFPPPPLPPSGGEPKRAIEAAARLFECAREQLEREQEGATLADERAQLEAEAERRDKYGFNLTGGNLSLEDAFALQKDARVRKGTRQAAYKTFRNFVKALREKGLIFRRFPKGTKEMSEKFVEGPPGDDD